MKQSIVDHFSDRASRYNKAAWVKNVSLFDSIGKCVDDFYFESCSILDHGAGTGAVSEYLLSRYSSNFQMTAVDICQSMLEQIQNPEIKKVVSSVESLPFEDNSFDVVVSRQCLHYVENLVDVIHEIKRVLKPNGLLVVCQFAPLENNTKVFWMELMKVRQPFRKWFYSSEEWRDAFTNQGFIFLTREDITHRYSVNTWAKLYSNEKIAEIETYKKLILNAPSKYVEDYKVSFDDNVIWTNGYSTTLAFRNEEKE